MLKFLLGFILLYSFLFSELLSETKQKDLAERKKKRISSMHEGKKVTNGKLPNQFQKQIPPYSEYITDPDFADMKRDTIKQRKAKSNRPLNQRQQIQKKAASIPNISTSMTVSSVDSLSPEWRVNYGSNSITHTHVIQSMAIDSVGGVYITGDIDDYNNNLTIKYNKDGEKIWQNTYENSAIEKIAVDKLGKNIYVLGYIYAEEDSLVLIKYDAAGNQTWVRFEYFFYYYETGWTHYPDYTTPIGLKLDSAGNIYIVSSSYNQDGYESFLIVKYNPDGKREWRKLYTGPNNDQSCYPKSFTVDQNGNVYVTGSIENDPTYIDIVTVKYSTSGSLIWTKIYKGKFEAEDLSYDIAVDASGSVYVVGNTYKREEDMDYILLKYSSRGTLRWSRIYDTGDQDEDPASIGVDGSNRIYLTSSFGTIRYTSSGSLQWIEADGYPIGPSGTAVTFDGLDNVLILTKYKYGYVQILTQEGEWIDDFSAFAIAIDKNRNLYIASRGDMEGVYKIDSLYQFVWRQLPFSFKTSSERFVDVVSDKNGNTYVAGLKYRRGILYGYNPEYLTLKFDSSGTLQWIKTINTNLSNRINSIAIDSSGNVFVTGFIDVDYYGGSSWDYLTIKYDSQGNQVWSDQFNGPENYFDIPYDMASDIDGNLYVAGRSRVAGNSDYTVIKYNPEGVRQWVSFYNGPTNYRDVAYDVALDKKGNIYVTGTSLDTLKKHDDFVTIKYDTSGTTQWISRFDGPLVSPSIWVNMPTSNNVVSLAVDDSGNVYVAGSIYLDSLSGEAFVIIKYNQLGEQQWFATYTSDLKNGRDKCYLLALDREGNIYLTGNSETGVTSSDRFDFVTIKYNPSGVRQWIQRYPGRFLMSNNWVTDISVNDFGDVYVTGTGERTTGESEFVTIKYRTDGTLQWISRNIDPQFSASAPTAMTIADNGNIFVGGTSFNSQEGSFCTLMKFIENVNISLSTEKIIFGEVSLGCFADTTLVVYNPGNVSVNVLPFSIDSNFTVLSKNVQIRPREHASVKLYYFPTIAGTKIGRIVFKIKETGKSDTITVEGIAVGEFEPSWMITQNPPGWNLISTPYVEANCPRTVPGLFEFDGQYQAAHRMIPGKGYWFKIQDGSFLFVGYPNLQETTYVYSGWNLIGSITNPLHKSSIITEPPDIITSPLYGYKTGYFIADSIIPGKAYWVKVSSPGKLILSTVVSVQTEKIIAISNDLEKFNMLMLQDAKDQLQRLYFDKKPNEAFSIDFFDLPPVPPSGVFDARFASQRMFEVVEENKFGEFPIQISSAEYPITLSWKMSNSSTTAYLKSDNREILLRGEGKVTISNPDSRITLKLNGTPDLPREFALEQNYPNPFNPATIIKYQLPALSKVAVKIYNIMGQELKTLVDEEQDAGYKTFEWNSINNFGNT
ncbi:MAG: SBBP repeat-containing protein, partial [Bacteroidota bacterium]|nr:SBBP repeat-containing protein [Bacteroidota bacterium]